MGVSLQLMGSCLPVLLGVYVVASHAYWGKLVFPDRGFRETQISQGHGWNQGSDFPHPPTLITDYP